MEGLQDKSGFWFAAIAFFTIMGTVIERIDMPSRIRKLFLQLLVDELHVRGPVLAECDAALVGNHDDFFPMGVENCDGPVLPRAGCESLPSARHTLLQAVFD